MSQILEAIMLICFGCSWPVSVVKNIKARTAKSMSLPFILLIITGYVAGIMAKIYSHTINYVFIIYLLNLAVVSINVVIYFINKRYDRLNDEANQICAEAIESDLAQLSDKAKEYEEMNDMTTPGGIVFFGSNFFADLPAAELAKTQNLEETIYNRSISDEDITHMMNELDACVLSLNPSKVFINLGDADINNGSLNVDEFISKYENILTRIHNKTNADIYVVSLLSSLPAAHTINEKLKELANKTKSVYIDAEGIANSSAPKKRLFDLLKCHLRTHHLSFADAMMQ